MTEIWKDVVGYEGIYEVSSFGRIRTHKDKTTYTEKHGVRHWKQCYLKNKIPSQRIVLSNVASLPFSCDMDTN